MSRFRDPEPLATDHQIDAFDSGVESLDSMRRALSVAESLGVRVLLVHAIDDRARAFYERFGFESWPTDPMNLQMLMKDIRAALERP